jgi:hypothetical protein
MPPARRRMLNVPPSDRRRRTAKATTDIAEPEVGTHNVDDEGRCSTSNSSSSSGSSGSPTPQDHEAAALALDNLDAEMDILSQMVQDNFQPSVEDSAAGELTEEHTLPLWMHIPPGSGTGLPDGDAKAATTQFVLRDNDDPIVDRSVRGMATIFDLPVKAGDVQDQQYLKHYFDTVSDLELDHTNSKMMYTLEKACRERRWADLPAPFCLKVSPQVGYTLQFALLRQNDNKFTLFKHVKADQPIKGGMAKTTCHGLCEATTTATKKPSANCMRPQRAGVFSNRRPAPGKRSEGNPVLVFNPKRATIKHTLKRPAGALRR